MPFLPKKFEFCLRRDFPSERQFTKISFGSKQIAFFFSGCKLFLGSERIIPAFPQHPFSSWISFVNSTRGRISFKPLSSISPPMIVHFELVIFWRLLRRSIAMSIWLAISFTADKRSSQHIWLDLGRGFISPMVESPPQRVWCYFTTVRASSD